jgi:hypothetical protein
MFGPTAILLIGASGSVIAVVWLMLTMRSQRGSLSAPAAGITIASIALILGGRLVNERWPGWHGWQYAGLIAVALAIMMGSAWLLRQLAPAPHETSPTSLDVMYP